MVDYIAGAIRAEIENRMTEFSRAICSRLATLESKVNALPGYGERMEAIGHQVGHGYKIVKDEPTYPTDDANIVMNENGKRYHPVVMVEEGYKILMPGYRAVKEIR